MSTQKPDILTREYFTSCPRHSYAGNDSHINLARLQEEAEARLRKEGETTIIHLHTYSSACLREAHKHIMYLPEETTGT